MKDFVKEYKARSGKIEKSRIIKKPSLSILPPDKSFKPKNIERKYGIALPDEITEFYEACDGFQLKWDAVINDRNVTGCSFLMSYRYFLSKKVTALENDDSVADFWPSEIKPGRAKELSKYYVIDDIGYSNYVLCEIESDRNEPSLCLYLRDDRIYKLTCSFDEYVSKTIEYGGIYLWQRYYCEEYRPSALDIEDNCAEYLSLLFPEVDISPFSARRFSLPNFSTEINYRSLFEKKIGAFKKKKGVKIDKFEIRPGVAAGVVAKAQYTIKRKLPDELLSFYSQIDGLALDWSAGKHGGSINIIPLENVFGGPIDRDGGSNKEWYRPEDYLGTLWFDEEAPNTLLLQKIRPVDIPSGVSNFMGADFLSEKEPVLYYSVGRDKEYRLSITFKEYFHLLLEYLGATHWQLLCVQGLTVRVGDFLLVEFIKSVLPEANFSKVN